MFDAEFGIIHFQNHWQAVNQIKLTLWNKEHYIYVCATAEDAEDQISDLQRSSYLKFKDSIHSVEKSIEDVLRENFPDLTELELSERFIPGRIIFSRDGNYGICIADNYDLDCAIQPDADIAIEFTPEIIFYDSQEEYLSFLY